MDGGEVAIDSLDGLLGERVEAVWKGNLRVLDWERDFIAPFREGRPTGTYVGMGKTLSGLNHMARLFGGEAAGLRQRIVRELLDAQEPSGYLGLYEPAARTCEMWDTHEQAYIIQALVESWAWFDDVEARNGAERLGRWLLPRVSAGGWRKAAKDGHWAPLVNIGLDRAMMALGDATGESAYLDFVRDDLDVPGWFDPIVEGRSSRVDGHAYAYLARCLAQLELLADDEPLPPATRAALEFLFQGGGLAISGTCGQEECWHSDQRADDKLGETCATAYLIRWAAQLLRRTGDAFFGDLVERAMYNALFAAGSPDGRRIRYYSPAEGPREWHPGDTYCCPGNYRRIVGELPRYIVHQAGEGLAVNLYEPCRLTTTAGGVEVALRLEGSYPWDSAVTISVEPRVPAEFPIRVRLPGWSARTTVEVNDELVGPAQDNGWGTISRRWQSGDRIRLTFDMPWRLVAGSGRQEGRAALMRGPMVWAANPALNAGAGDELPSAVLNVAHCETPDDPRVCRTSGTLPDGREVNLQLTPFFDPDVTVTYFAVRPSVPAERDHLLR